MRQPHDGAFLMRQRGSAFSSSYSLRVVTIIVAALAVAATPTLFAQQSAVLAPPPAPSTQPGPQGRPCRATGRIVSGEVPLPGTTVTVRDGDRVVAATSTDLDGRYSIAIAPGRFTLRVELTGFAGVDREIVSAAEPPCEVQTDLSLGLASRASRPPAASEPTPAPAPPVVAGGTAGSTQQAQAGRGGRGGRGRGGPPRFESLSVRPSDAATTSAAASQTAANTSTTPDVVAGAPPDDRSSTKMSARIPTCFWSDDRHEPQSAGRWGR